MAEENFKIRVNSTTVFDGVPTDPPEIIAVDVDGTLQVGMEVSLLRTVCSGLIRTTINQMITTNIKQD